MPPDHQDDDVRAATAQLPEQLGRLVRNVLVISREDERPFGWTPEDAAVLRDEIVALAAEHQRLIDADHQVAITHRLLAEATGWQVDSTLYGYDAPEPDLPRVWDQDGRPWDRVTDDEIDSTGSLVEVTRWIRRHRLLGRWVRLPLTMHETWSRGPLWRGIVADHPPVDLHTGERR